jgi:Terminase RNaseH-like domain
MVRPSEVTIRLKRPHPAQARFLASTAQRRALKCGRRSGKTTGLGILAVQEFLRGERVLYHSPTSEQILKFWAEVTAALSDPIRHGIFRKNETLHLIELPGTEQCIRAKTAWEPDHLRGDFGSVILLDEYQLFSERCWGEVIAPMTLDRNARVVFAMTPPSLRTISLSKASDPRHATKLFQQAQSDTSGRWSAFYFTSFDNPHLSRQALADITSDMSVRAYQQEILALDALDVEGALWTQALLDKTRVGELQVPPLSRIVVAVDPAATSQESSDEMGIVVAGLGADGHGYTLRDASARGTPAACAKTAISVYDTTQADALIAEANNGGEWIETVVRFVAAEMHRLGERSSPAIHYKMVHASRSKQTRAEPIAAEYEHGRVHHVGTFPALESEMTGWVPGMPSPSRMDATVWAYTELLLHAPKKVGMMTLRY